MKKEYDFSRAQRGRFYRPGVKLKLPVYLEDEVLAYVQALAQKRRSDPSAVVNGLIRGEMKSATGSE